MAGVWAEQRGGGRRGDATLRDSNDPTNNNTKSFRKYRNTRRGVPSSSSRSAPPSASLPLASSCDLSSLSLSLCYLRTYYTFTEFLPLPSLTSSSIYFFVFIVLPRLFACLSFDVLIDAPLVFRCCSSPSR